MRVDAASYHDIEQHRDAYAKNRRPARLRLRHSLRFDFVTVKEVFITSALLRARRNTRVTRP